MTTYRARGSSPPVSYGRVGDPRTSSGSVISSSFTPQFDPRYAQHPRGSLDTLPATRRDRPYVAPPAPRRTYPAQPYAGPTESRTQYAIRPRNDPPPEEDRRRSMAYQARPAPSSRPIVNNYPRERSPPPRASHPRDDADRYIYPASSGSRQHHQRQYETPVDNGRLSIRDKERRERGPYRDAGSATRGTHAPSSALVRTKDGKDDDDYSYTGPEEQFDKGLFQPRARHGSYTRRDRPISSAGFPDYKPSAPSKREPAPPPSSTRHFDKLEKPDHVRTSHRPNAESDNEYEPEFPRRRHSTRAPIDVHQSREAATPSSRGDRDERHEVKARRDRHEEDSAYFSERDNRDHQPASHHSDRRHRKRREDSQQRESSGKGLAVAGLGGVAAAGLANVIAKEPRNGEDSNEDTRKSRRHRRRKDSEYEEADLDGKAVPTDRRSKDRPQEVLDESTNGVSINGRGGRERTDSDSLEDDGARQHRHRRRHRERENDRLEPDAGFVADARPQSVERTRDARNYEERVIDDNDDHIARQRDRDEPALRRERSVGPSEEPEDNRQRRVQLVEPVKDKDSEVKPKGILKAPRAVPFPEDPNPTREGVAPLKEAGVEGVPPGARWTKINRKLVNPAALEAANERFEERDDFVIVLRVVKKEEIEKLAAKTQELRDAREEEWREEHARRKRRENSRYVDDDDRSREREPLAIEAPAMPQAYDPRYAAAANTHLIPGNNTQYVPALQSVPAAESRYSPANPGFVPAPTEQERQVPEKSSDGELQHGGVKWQTD